MAGLPLSNPSFTTAPTTQFGSPVYSLGGLVNAVPLKTMLEAEKRQAEVNQAQPIVSSLAHHVRKQWWYARDARRNTIDDRMLRSIRARRGEYDPDKMAQIKEMGGSDVYAQLTSVKCRAAASWLRDVMLANGTEKPWTIRPTPVPNLPPNIAESIIQQVSTPIAQAYMAGAPMPDEQILDLMGTLRDEAMNQVREQARQMAERMENKMEDQLEEGGFTHALNQFIDDIVTYPAAIIKGPVVRNKNLLTWEKGPKGTFVPNIQRQPRLEWERVSPFNIYPAPESESVNDGYLIEKHRLSREDLNDLIGVEGYDDASIRLVLETYGRGGLRDWLYDDVGRAAAEGKSTVNIMVNPDQYIDALQYWGSVQGRILIEWGIDPKEIDDEMKDYNCEVWLIGAFVIKATLNFHPLGEKPYYKAAYEEIPGSFWGNSPADLIRDAQTVVNAASRALVNNMGLASGPQVVVNVDRLAQGEDVTQLRPWRIWQVTSDPLGNGATQPPMIFNQPQSNVNELSSIITTFMNLADEWSGIPRYLTGNAPGGAGRTASGLSMLMSNAGKALKQVVANVDNYVMRLMLERLYFWNMRYGDDPDLKGDINIVVRGANALVAQEAAQQRRSEFLAVTNNPTDNTIVGPTGRAHILREVAKGLDMDVDKIIPNDAQLKLNLAEANALAMQQVKNSGAPAAPGGPTPAAPPPGAPSQSGQSLMDGSPQTDLLSPSQ